jgi:hypothetical protein
VKLIVSNGTLSTSSSSFYIIICGANEKTQGPPKKLIESSGGPNHLRHRSDIKCTHRGNDALQVPLFFSFFSFPDLTIITGDGRILSSFGVFCRCSEKRFADQPSFDAFRK